MIAAMLKRLKRLDIYSPAGDLYLRRYIIYGNKKTGRSIYLHHFIGPDYQAHLHDHPKRFIIIGLRGGNSEIANSNRGHGWINRLGEWTNVFVAPFIRTFGTDFRHKITSVQPNTWTLAICFKHTKHWGFYTEDGFKVWWDYCEEYGRPYTRSDGDEE